jgi:hypothetical protein
MAQTPAPDWRNYDGGYGPVDGAPSEPEATAMVALAFDDEPARAWLLRSQQADGSVGMRAGSVVRELTGIAALAMPAGAAREHALDHLLTVYGDNGDAEYSTAGWPWTAGSHGWTEPTAWGLMAARLRQDADDRREDALSFFRERECDGGGWNYGAPETLGVPLGPYAQTTALAMLAIGRDDPDLVARAGSVLERMWRREADGPLSLATSVCALRVIGSDDAGVASSLLEANVGSAKGDTVATAWVAFARGAEPPPWGLT